MTLADLNRRTCAAYVSARGRQPSARRELKITRGGAYHWQAGLCSGLTPVALPEKSLPRDRWLTRSEAARLLWAAWRHCDLRSNRPNAQHVARFILVALYTGTRAGAVCGAALAPTEGRGWIDLDQGVFYRRALGRRGESASPRYACHSGFQRTAALAAARAGRAQSSSAAADR
jgi:integrase